jgi:hypothetical protein
MDTDAVMDVEYREHYDRGAAAGRDAQRALPDAELAGVRIRVQRIADALETAWYDAAYARGFLKATDPVPEFRQWRRQPHVRRHRRQW